MTELSKHDRDVPLGLSVKLAYGAGEWSGEIPGSLLVYFILFFLTNVAGLSPGMAGGVLLAGKIWDAANDPIVGWLSDRTRSARWGRRFPWMLAGALPLGASFALLWWVPSGLSPMGLAIYYGAIALVYYAAFTVVRVPYTTLAAELTEGYDERTSLASYKAGFSIAGSIVGLLIAQGIFSLAVSPRQQFATLGSVCGTIAAAATFVCVWGTRRRYWTIWARRRGGEPAVAPAGPSSSIWGQLLAALRCGPFKFVIGIYLCSWISLQLTAAILPYFTVNWMGLGEGGSIRMLLVVQGTAMVAIVLWSRLGKRLGKRAIFCWGIPSTIAAQLGLFGLAPGQETAMYALGALAGLGLATAYLVPWSMLPDAIDVDELHSGERREGIFYGSIVQLQKVGAALTVFGLGLLLEYSGFVAAGEGAAVTQPPRAVALIRWAIGPIPAAVLLLGVAIAAFYPITREVHGEIVLKLVAQRQQKRESAAGNSPE